MSKYTIKDVSTIVPENLTSSQVEAIELYLNEGVIPEADPCMSCEPNYIRKLISLIQVGERNGLFPPQRAAEEDTGYTAGEMSEEDIDMQMATRPELYADLDRSDLEQPEEDEPNGGY